MNTEQSLETTVEPVVKEYVDLMTQLSLDQLHYDHVYAHYPTER